jgi:hypothetical protein
VLQKDGSSVSLRGKKGGKSGQKNVKKERLDAVPEAVAPVVEAAVSQRSAADLRVVIVIVNIVGDGVAAGVEGTGLGVGVQVEVKGGGMLS